jgi:hypothetical protein
MVLVNGTLLEVPAASLPQHLNEALMEAVATGDKVEVVGALEAGADVNATMGGCATQAACASQCRLQQVVRRFREACCSC